MTTRGRSSAAKATLAPPSPGLAQLEAELSTLFRQAREVFRATALDVDEELNITGYVTLIRIVDEGPLRASTLVDDLGTDKGAMSRQLAHLERLGLVRRTKDPVDGRAQIVSATSVAVRRCQAARDRSKAAIRERISGWDESRIDAFAALLHDFNAALGARSGPDQQD